MRIQYCSDLHLEFDQNSEYLSKNPLQVKGDILILAGDIAPLHNEFLSNPFFTFVTNNYKQVFWVPGNHEMYYKDISEFGYSIHLKLRSNLQIVHNVNFEYEGIQFIFSTLWSKISKKNEKIIEQSVSDFSCISKGNRKFRASDFNVQHSESLQFLQNATRETKKPSIIVTHHLPLPACNKTEHANSPINEAFCVDLSPFAKTCGANFWIYGHSHFNQKALFVGETVFLTNQLGYVHCNEHQNFKHNAYFSV